MSQNKNHLLTICQSPKPMKTDEIIKTHIGTIVDDCLDYYQDVDAVDKNLKGTMTILYNIINLSSKLGKVRIFDLHADAFLLTFRSFFN
jgi:hypothetical protein